MSDTGFFDLKDISIIRGDEIPKKKDIISSGNCEDCKLYKTCTHPKIPIWGYGRKKIMIILDFPSENEDLYGLPFSGSYGNFLKDVFNKKEARHLCLYIFSVDDKGKVEEYSPKDFKKFQ